MEALLNISKRKAVLVSRELVFEASQRRVMLCGAAYMFS
jgi:hypothetical protein